MKWKARDWFCKDCLIHEFGATGKDISEHGIVVKTCIICIVLVMVVIIAFLRVLASKMMKKVLESIEWSSLNIR